MIGSLTDFGARAVAAALLVSGFLLLQLSKPAFAQNVAWPARDVADLDIADLVNVRVSPFEVSLHLDAGYRASNSVSGSRFDAPIRDLPFAIQAFTESFIADQKPRTVFDVARYSPGVTYRSNDFNEGNANVAIRGFAISATPGNVQILRDGFHGPSILDLTNVARVEVVKGPASFLYGQVAPGGIVNVITRHPQSRFAASADATVGSYGQYRVDADITGPASSTLFYRLVASRDEDMHYWKPYEARSRNIAPALLWQPNERLSLSLKYDNFHRLETPQLMQKPGYNRQAGVVPTAVDPNLSGVDVPGLPDNWNGVADPDYRRSDTRNFSAWLDYAANDHWNLRAGHSRLKYEIDMLFSGNYGMANNSTLLQGRRFRKQVYTNWGDTFEVEAVGKYRFDDISLRLLFGAQRVERRFDNRAAQAPNDPALGSDPTASPLPLWDLADPTTWNRTVNIPLSALTVNPTDQTTRFADRSIYAGTTFGFFADRLLVLAGWRRTATESRLTNHLTGVSLAPIEASAVTPQYGMLYKLTPQVSIFASYAESFVPGTQILRNLDGTNSPAAPSRGNGFDIGLKADLFDGRVSGTVSLFDIRNKNIVNDIAMTDNLGNVVIYNVQSGEQRSRGLELDATIRPRHNWQIYLSYSYMNARIVEFSGRDKDILAQDPATLDDAGRLNYKAVNLLHNAPLQMSAPHIVNLWTRHDLANGWYVAGGFNHIRNQTLLPDSPAFARQTYTLLNATLGHAWRSGERRMSIDLMGKNLLDEKYRPSQSTRGRPREFLLTFKASF